MTTDIVEKHFHTIISHTMVCYRTSWDFEWKVFCFLAGGTFLFAVQIRRYLLRWYFTSRKRYIDSFYRHRSQCRTLHPIPFFRYRLLAIHSSLVPSRPQKRDERKKQNALCFVFSLSGTLTSLSPFFVLLRRSSRFVPCLRGKKNSLQTVQAQVEGNAHV